MSSALDARPSSRPQIGRAHRDLRTLSGPRLSGWAGFWLTLLVIVFASRCVWYDCRIVFDWMRGDGLRVAFAAYTLALLPFLALAGIGGLHLLTRSWTTLLFVWIGVQGLLCAVLHGHIRDPYVLQDLVKLTFLPAGFIWVWLDPPKSFDLFLRRTAYALLAYQGIKLLIYMFYYQGSFSFYYGEVIDLFPLCYFLGKYCRERPEVAERFLLWTLLAAAIIVLGQRRTVLVGGCVIVAYMAIRSYSHLMGRPTLYVLALIAAVSLFGASGLWSHLSESLLQRVVNTDVADSIGEDSTRFREVQLVVDQMLDAGPATSLFGFGHGATFEDEVANRDTGEFVKHSVHFTPGAMLLRYGVVGLLFFAVVVGALTFAREPEIDGWIGAPNYLAMKAFGLAAAVGSLTLYGLMDDLMIGAFLGGCCWARSYAASQAFAPRERAVLPVPQDSLPQEDAPTPAPPNLHDRNQTRRPRRRRDLVLRRVA
ncbi:MAG TPA: hypothetical protein VGN57_10795 [Pirellulaceae bacterium]|jgi:hypothetical protein|nr:hypothetical protein [Pirellulaceae bacterium]